jgi:hypothetical protein
MDGYRKPNCDTVSSWRGVHPEGIHPEGNKGGEVTPVGSQYWLTQMSFVYVAEMKNRKTKKRFSVFAI